MLVWRLSGVRHSKAFDGSYGLEYDGRWNTAQHPVTYCSTSPALCVLEKLVHIADFALLPALMMVRYDAPDRLATKTLTLRDLPDDWRQQEAWTQRRGDEWQEALATPLLRVPSAIVPVDPSPDANILINHRHSAAGRITLVSIGPFIFDPRLFKP